MVGELFGEMIFLSDVFRFLEWWVGQLLISVLVRLWKTRCLILELGQREAIVEAAHEEEFLFSLMAVIELSVSFIRRGEDIFERRFEFSDGRLEEVFVFKFLNLQFE